MMRTDSACNAVVFKGRYIGSQRSLHVGLIIEPYAGSVSPHGYSVDAPGYTDPWERKTLFIAEDDIMMYMICD